MNVEKRRERDDAAQSPLVKYKRQKFIDMRDSSGIHETVGANELASAFALASLATMSPTSQVINELSYESRDADHGDDAVPISPDVRSPVRSPKRRVWFSNDTKETSRQTSRKLSFPPRVKPQGSRMPPGFMRSPYPLRAQQHLPPPWMNHRMMAHQASVFMPPPSMMPPTPSPPDKWICDFCNVAAFDTYQAACVHEESCRVRCSMQQRRAPQWQATPPRIPMLHTYSPSHAVIHPVLTAATTGLAHSKDMVDTQNGIRFSTNPQADPACFDIEYQSSIDSSINELPKKNETDTESSSGEKEGHPYADGDNIVRPDDIAMIPPYVYFLMCQVERTHFTEADRFVARSKGPVGFSGFQCRHCHGHAGLGKYFPVSSKSLSTNSTSQNIHSHLLKCRKVTPYVKEQLAALKEEKGKAPRFEPGWRRVFFEKIWSRLHG
jgi:hypothetical protein